MPLRGRAEVDRLPFAVRFWGVRGSLPVFGEDFRHFGGNTMCLEVRCGDTRLIFDAGSGILPAGQALKAEGVTRYHLLFTHSHYDHIIGFPYFAPIFDRNASIDIWSGHLAGKMTTGAMLRDFMRPPWFPVEPSICPAHIRCRDFMPGDAVETEPGIAIRTGNLNHPGGAVGYRVDFGGRSLAVITDTEHDPGVLDPAVMDLIAGVDLFLYDASYLEPEMDKFRGFGHSTWQQACMLAKAAGAGRVGMVHHAPWRSDAALHAIEAEAQAVFPGAFFAAEGATVTL
jgi:phosphoribosyl 1,2-cyclic phosphodiesterase